MINNANAEKWVPAGADGKWTANFSGVHDLKSGEDGWVHTFDAYGNVTYMDWKALNPNLQVSAFWNWIQAYDWLPGTGLTLTIDDPSTPQPVDYTGTTTMGPAPWNPGDPNSNVGYFDLSNKFNLNPGMIITVTDGRISRTMTVSNIEVTAIDAQADTVSGIGAPGQLVHVCANNTSNGCVTRWAVPALNGSWTVNYHNPGTFFDPTTGWADDGATVDLVAGMDGWANQYDWPATRQTRTGACSNHIWKSAPAATGRTRVTGGTVHHNADRG